MFAFVGVTRQRPPEDTHGRCLPGTIVFVTALPVEDGQAIDPLMGVLESASEAVQESANEGAPSSEQQLFFDDEQRWRFGQKQE